MLVRILRVFPKLFGNRQQKTQVFQDEADEEIQLRLKFYFEMADLKLRVTENHDDFVSCMLLCPITKQIIELEVRNKFKSCRDCYFSNQFAISEAFSVATNILKSNPNKLSNCLSEQMSNFIDKLGELAATYPLRKLRRLEN